MANVFPPHDLLTSQQVMALKESELVIKLKEMQTPELERHAENIMKEMGSSNYSQIMASVMKALKQDNIEKNQFKIVQTTLEELLPNKAYFSDIYARLGAIVMSIIARKFKAML
jgi:spore coat polysaccharide biosynthesis predicted glycosyltransferase SpsG